MNRFKVTRNTVFQRNIIFLAAVLGVFYSPTLAFTCYKCISNDNAPCIEELNPIELPSSILQVECEGYCTIVRTEYTDIPGEVVTLVRDCSQETPLVLNDVRTDKHYTKMYTSCNTDRCNSGEGKRLPGENEGPVKGPSSVIIVPESSNSGKFGPSIFAMLPLLFLYICLR